MGNEQVVETDAKMGLIRLIIDKYGQASLGIVCVLLMGAGGIYAFQSIIVPQLNANREERDKLQGMSATIERASQNIESAAIANKETATSIERASQNIESSMNASKETAKVLQAVTDQLLTLVRETTRERTRTQ